MTLKVLLGFSVVAGIAALFIHLLTFLPEPSHIPTAVVFPLALLLIPPFAKSAMILKERNQDLDPKLFWKRAFDSAPAWVGTIVLTMLIYTFFNFFFSLLVLNEGLTPDLMDGQFVLHSHGHITRVLTEEAYFIHKDYELRGMSTHIIFFHAVAAAVLWSEIRRTSAA